MSDWHILRYTPDMAPRWDEFVEASRNATFLFKRAYMDYHADRFEDCSWMVWKGNKLAALLPANITADGTLQSHGGLSYGGWILPAKHIDGADLLDFFSEAIEVWKTVGIRELDYKPIPGIYTACPSQEDIYALFRLGGKISECNLSATIDLQTPHSFNTLQRRHLKKALAAGVEIRERKDIAPFMALLRDCLAERHGVAPVHTLEEMRLLAGKFPKNIRFFEAVIAEEIHAGVCIYDTGRVAHAQYIATDSEGRRLNLLAALFDYLIEKEFADRRYFDFGISNENHGLYLNAGLLRQKHSYGATGTATLRYHLKL